MEYATLPRNGSGTFAAAASSVNPAVASTTIEVAPFNTLIDDIESGLSESIARDGQTATTARIPFASGISTDTITEVTGAAGVTIDSVLLKDGGATLSDSVTYIADNADATKKVQFQVSGVTTATTRVLTVPNFDGTIATLAGTETLTNKTLTSPTINTASIASPTITTPTLDLSTVTTANPLTVAKGGTGAATFTDAGVLIGNGTGAIQVTSAGTAGQVLTSNGAGVDPTFQAVSGVIRQIVEATPHVANTDVSAVIPYDDTKPLISEGTEINTLTITLTSAANKVRLTARGFCSGDASAAMVTAALHRTGEASNEALQATGGINGSNSNPIPYQLDFIETPGSVGPHTYSVRLGATAGTARVNGATTARRYGGAAGCTLVAEEIAV